LVGRGDAGLPAGYVAGTRRHADAPTRICWAGNREP